jgi:hypothetical protein
MIVAAVPLLAVGLLWSTWTWILAIRVWRMPSGPEKQRLNSRYWRLRMVGIALALAGGIAIWLAAGYG